MPWHAQDDDRRAGTQAVDRALAPCHDGRDFGGRRPASGGLGPPGTASSPYSALALAFSADCRLTIRGGGKPYSNMALMPTERMGPPPGASPPMRMTASWSGSNDPTEYKCAARDPRPMGAPLGSSADRQPSDAGALQKSPCRYSSSLRVLWGQGAAKHKRRYAARRQALLAFRSLDPFRALREPDRRRRDEATVSVGGSFVSGRTADLTLSLIHI